MAELKLPEQFGRRWALVNEDDTRCHVLLGGDTLCMTVTTPRTGAVCKEHYQSYLAWLTIKSTTRGRLENSEWEEN